MTLLRALAHEVFAMFVADVGVTVCALGLVGLVALLRWSGVVAPQLAGGVLVLGTVAILVGFVLRAARGKRR